MVEVRLKAEIQFLTLCLKIKKDGGCDYLRLDIDFRKLLENKVQAFVVPSSF